MLLYLLSVTLVWDNFQNYDVCFTWTSFKGCHMTTYIKFVDKKQLWNIHSQKEVYRCSILGKTNLEISLKMSGPGLVECWSFNYNWCGNSNSFISFWSYVWMYKIMLQFMYIKTTISATSVDISFVSNTNHFLWYLNHLDLFPL